MPHAFNVHQTVYDSKEKSFVSCFALKTSDAFDLLEMLGAKRVLHKCVLHTVAGSVDAGKSSLVGVLTHGIDGRPLLDNGSGSARMNVFQHKHEIETGRTSSLSQQMLGYDEQGKLHGAFVSLLQWQTLLRCKSVNSCIPSSTC